ncbi:hypothetical protein NVIRPANT_00532 [Pantoea sp. Nvir]|nr:hypothetical protein NVIRPANT_00532 [Pantoea sp. Nvir]
MVSSTIILSRDESSSYFYFPCMVITQHNTTVLNYLLPFPSSFPFVSYPCEDH